MSGRGAANGYRERNTTADRALDILTMFGDEQVVVTGPLVAERLGVSRSTAYRYLQSLVSAQFLEDAPGGGFRLGLRVLELARLARRTFGLSDIAAPVIHELAQDVGEVVLVTRRTGDLVVCLDRAESHERRVRISYERGTVLPINAGASATVLLAWSDPEEARQLLARAELKRFTDATLTDVDALVDRMAHIRSDGYAVARSELDPKIMGIAAPIWGPREGEVVGAVSVAGLVSRIPPKVERVIVAKVRLAAARISERYSVVQS
ncbi:IclR family transcriptional regulator [Pseudonocardia xinjiangensis]|uniref:IclR family transcriptional regulator n=1 Tax=Pseudonocardia xinjiangensis TaxID=75289 RepID=UPI003D89B3A3